MARERRMQARGWEEVERAKGDGRWEGAYDGAVPRDLEEAMMGDERAKGVWQRLGKGERSAFAYRLVGVRTEEGRARAVGRIVEELASRGGEEMKQLKGRQAGKRKRGVDEERQEVVEEKAPSVTGESRAQRAERRAERKGEADGK